MTVSISPYDLTEQIDIHLFGDLAIDFLGDRERNKVHKHMQAWIRYHSKVCFVMDAWCCPVVKQNQLINRHHVPIKIKTFFI